MKVFSIAKGFYRATKNAPPELSQKEQNKLRAMRLYRETEDVVLVCKTFEISRATLYRWLKRFNPMDLTTIKDKSRKPKRLRKPKWSYELIIAVKELRRQYPRWGKEKLYPLLKTEGWETSESTVGRIVGYLKNKGDLVEPQRKAISAKRKLKRLYAIRKPKDYTAKRPGDIVQVDTLDIRPLPGIVLKQFTSRDVISKWDVIEVRSRATARTAGEFVKTLSKRMPFKIKAIQVDGGSEFYSDFEKACKDKGIRLFVLPPKSPKLNGCRRKSQ